MDWTKCDQFYWADTPVATHFLCVLRGSSCIHVHPWHVPCWSLPDFQHTLPDSSLFECGPCKAAKHSPLGVWGWPWKGTSTHEYWCTTSALKPF